MIPVVFQPEPSTFDAQVRQLGIAAMDAHSGEWTRSAFWSRRKNKYWSRCLDDLYIAYEETCAYLAVWIPRGVSSGIGCASVEHFVPVLQGRHLAYEWNNYRLTSSLANNVRDTMLVLDPFTLPPDVFGLRLNSGEVFLRQMPLASCVQATKNTLLVVNNRTFSQYRAVLFTRYKAQPDVLRKESPFIHAEAVRQGQLAL